MHACIHTYGSYSAGPVALAVTICYPMPHIPHTYIHTYTPMDHVLCRLQVTIHTYIHTYIHTHLWIIFCRSCRTCCDDLLSSATHPTALQNDVLLPSLVVVNSPCMYVCIYVCIYVYMYVYSYTQSYFSRLLHVCMCVCMYTHAYMLIPSHTQTHINTHT